MNVLPPQKYLVGVATLVLRPWLVPAPWLPKEEDLAQFSGTSCKASTTGEVEGRRTSVHGGLFAAFKCGKHASFKDTRGGEESAAQRHLRCVLPCVDSDHLC